MSQSFKPQYVIVKLWPGKSEQQKIRLAEEIVKDVMSALNCGEESVSVVIEEVKPPDWAETVYKPDILNNPEKLFQKPGHDTFMLTLNTGIQSHLLVRF